MNATSPEAASGPGRIVLLTTSHRVAPGLLSWPAWQALHAADRVDSGERADLEAGMAKLFASESAMQNALDAVRVHGGYGYSTEFDVERYFRDAPLMIVGEGTNEIQRNVIAGQLVKRGGL